jgi:hypothetical protein
MRDEERYEDCHFCDDGYTGEDAIRSYMREIEIEFPEGDGAAMVCLRCAAAWEKLSEEEKRETVRNSLTRGV